MQELKIRLCGKELMKGGELFTIKEIMDKLDIKHRQQVHRAVKSGHALHGYYLYVDNAESHREVLLGRIKSLAISKSKPDPFVVKVLENCISQLIGI